MVPRNEGWTIVLAGHWNRMIFTPVWVGQHLFPGNQQVETLVAILPIFPMIYQNAEIMVEVSTPRIVLHPRQLTDANLVRAETMAQTILQELDDTPLTGVGINFEFVQAAPPEGLLALFNMPDNMPLAEAGWNLGERRIVRRLQNGNTVLNLTIILQQSAVHFEFNFHTETTVNAEAQAAVAGKILNLRNTALQIMAETYHLQPE
jgi:hypothetical protein